MIVTSFLIRSVKLANKEDRHEISDKFDFGPVSTIGMRVNQPEGHIDLGEC